MVPVQREIAQGHTNEDALTLGIIRGAIAKLGQSYSINRLLRQPELLVQRGGAGAEWTRQVVGLIESGDKAVIANSAQALMRRGYSGEEALALALMPEKPESFLINGFRALAQNGEIQRDILLSRIAPQVYRRTQSTSGGAVAPSSGPAAQSSGQTAASDSALIPFVRNSFGSIPAAPVTDAITKAARNLLASSHDTIRQMADTARTRPLLADGPQGYEENETRQNYEEVEADEHTQETNIDDKKDLTDEQKDDSVNHNQNSLYHTGARITDPYSEPAEKHAEKYYGLIRAMKTDVIKIANNTGFPLDDIGRIKQYLFVEVHDLGEGKIAQFDSDFAIAQSWQRLMSGNYEPVDLTLLRHEMLEYKLVKSGMTQNEAHIIASSTYNYTAETEEYYASLKKH